MLRAGEKSSHREGSEVVDRGDDLLPASRLFLVHGKNLCEGNIQGVIALILAAGYGTRLRPHSRDRPKCLMEIEPGVTLLEYQLKQLREAGISNVFVVTRPELAKRFEKYVDSSHIIRVKVSKREGNLVTLVKAWEQLNRESRDDLLVIMSDHLFERSLLNRLLQARNGRLLLCVDREPRGSIVEEGLKVAMDGTALIAASKETAPIQGIDTGLFFIPKELLGLAERLVESGRGALADLVNEASKLGKVGCVNVTGSLWLDVDSSRDLYMARKMYPKILARDLVDEGDGPISRHLNRKLSTPISLFLYQHRIQVNPNLLTLSAACLGVLASLSLFWNPLVGVCLILLTSIMDGLDGEVARLFGRTSRFGAALDNLCDRVVDALLISVACLWVYQAGMLSAQPLLLLAVFTIMGSSMVSYLSNWLGWGEEVCRLRNSFPPATRDVRLFALAVGFAFEHPEMALLYILVSSWIFAGRAIAGLEKPRRGELPKRNIFPEILPHPGMELEGALINTLSLILTVYFFQRALAIIPPLGSTGLLVERGIAVFGALTVIFFSLRLLRNILGILTGLKEHVVRRFWVSPGLYEKLGHELGALVALLIAHFLVDPLSQVFGLSEWVIQILDLALQIPLCIVGVKLFLDFIRTFEHKIRRSVGPLFNKSD